MISIMSKAELRKITELLKAKRNEIGRTLPHRDAIAIEQVPDAIDQTQLAVDRELAISRLDRDYSILQSVDAALRRMEDGTYGHCLHCEEEISLKRLQAVPWTSFCLSCQEEFDRHHSRSLSEAASDFESILHL
jgi:DnaK suppressor protein